MASRTCTDKQLAHADDTEDTEDTERFAWLRCPAVNAPALTAAMRHLLDEDAHLVHATVTAGIGLEDGEGRRHLGLLCGSSGLANRR
jgi:hypothetical protein